MMFTRRVAEPADTPDRSDATVRVQPHLTHAARQWDGRIRVVVATTVLLSFISFWRAAAIVLSDLGSTAFYVGGIVEQAVGKPAPWFILGVMLFSYAVRAVYVESSAMFVRGGVYRVVKEAMGGTLAKLSVSALLFDYVLTGPISGVSAGQYIVGLLNDLLRRSGSVYSLPVDATAALIAILITAYFWWRNTQGLHESSEDALRIMKVTTVMVVIMIAWCGLTLLWRGGALPPAPTPRNLRFSPGALGWLRGTVWPQFTAIALLVGFGHSILAMSGEESLAQVYREIEHPKVRNLLRTGMIIFVYSLVFTSLVSFFAIAIIPDAVRPRFYDNLISGLAMNVVGPLSLRLIFQAFVVLVGFLILAGAVNTAIVGSNGVLNRVSEDGVLTEWFRRPHPRFGTSYRLINLVVLLQVVTIVLSRGDVYVLGEAYAFGVVWSFAFKSLAVLVLRYTEAEARREWRVPLNIRVGRIEVPIGLALITVVLFLCAAINLFTKQTATISGLLFTGGLYAVFVTSEKITRRRRAAGGAEHTDQFQLLSAGDASLDAVSARPGCVVVPVRDYNTLTHLDRVVRETDTEARDIVVLTIRLIGGPDAGLRLDHEDLFTDYEQKLFTRVVAIAERHGRSVKLLVLPATNIYDAVAQAAVRLRATDIVVGESAKMAAADQARHLGEAWDRTPHDPDLATRLVVQADDGRELRFSLGAHAPELSADDIERIHRLWLRAVEEVGPRVHHRDIVSAAIESLEDEIRSDDHDKAVSRLLRRIGIAAGLFVLCTVGTSSAQTAETKPAKATEPFAFADFTWLTGNPRTRTSALDTKVFTGEFRVDTNFSYSFNHPADDTIVGSSEVFRSGEFQLTQLGVGGDFHDDNVRARVMTQFGMYAQTTPRNDASPSRGQWALDTAYRYISEAYGGYHLDALHGINIDAGLFMSYVGLDSYYQFDNWSYQPSYVSSNTPWFFNGVRVQIFPTDRLKIEPWIVNGWQSYGRFNEAPGIGGQILWRPTGSLSLTVNNYWGKDAPGVPERTRVHTDDSIQVKYHDNADRLVSKAAFTLTIDAGCESGGGVVCRGGDAATPSQFFLGFMAYHRLWFADDRYALTVGGGAIDNPGRYLVLLPPINGATAASGTPYFTQGPGDRFSAWDGSVTFDVMPSQFATFRVEANHRAASVPYFAGAGGVTPPGGNTPVPGALVPGWNPDLRRSENRVTVALLVKL